MFFVASSALLRRGGSAVAAWQGPATRLFGGGGGGVAPFRSSASFLHTRGRTTVSVTSLYSSSTSETSAQATEEEDPQKQSKKKKKNPVPITLLSGFLGTGKTTTLKHLLENTQGTKIGVIVNDVASVNIDAKLITDQTVEGMVELQNGCACCSLADELFFSIQKIMRDRDLDSIVVELSGVADPMAIKNNWKMAPDFVKDKANVARVVTVLDAASFGTDFMTWDEARERKGWVAPADEFTSSGQRKVSELLAEQVEAADLLLLNKCDLADGEEQIQVARAVAKALNDKADLKRVEYGKISPDEVLGVFTTPTPKPEDEACDDPDCSDTTHSHSHDHHADAEASCNDPDCDDPSHSHSHEHAHDDNDDSEATCNDPDCTDTSHSHSHSHATSTDQLGIVNFVYKASRPFDAARLMEYLNRWPVPVKDTLDVGFLQQAQTDGYEVNGQARSDAGDSPFVGVLRSKGFCWFSPNKWSGANEDAWRHSTAMYWSHAGKSFSISSAGKWWGTLDKESMKKYFYSNMDEYDRILREDFVTEEFGDRRNEIVFIGTNLDEEKITKILDSCLKTDEEMEMYRQQLRNYEDTLLAAASVRPGLFDVGGSEHTDAVDQ